MALPQAEDGSPQPQAQTDATKDRSAESTSPKVKRAVFVRPPMYGRQLAAIYSPARYSVIEASTKSGKTWGCIVWLLEKALEGRRGRNFWWVAPVFGQAKIAFRRLKRALPP